MDFSAPRLFWLLTLLIPLGWRLLSTERRLGRLYRHFRADTGSRARRIARCLLPLCALAALIMALAGPRITLLRPGDPGIHLVLAVGIDVSKSMLAEDAPFEPGPNEAPLPNRLNAARSLVLELLARLHGGRIGLFFFARNGIEVVAPTPDHGFVRYMVTHTELADLTESGSNLLAALDSGLLMTRGRPGAGAVILVTDGEDTENSLPEILRGLAAMRDSATPVFTVGVGSDAGVFIPIRRKGATGIDGFYADQQGVPLKTRLDPQPLREIAAASGGAYFELGTEPADRIADRLLQQVRVSALAPADLPSRPAAVDLAPFFLLGSLLFYSIFLLL